MLEEIGTLLPSIVTHPLGAFGIGVIISLVASSIPGLAVALVHWIKSRRSTISVKVKTGLNETIFNLEHLSSQDLTSIIEALKDKSDGRTAKS